MIPHSKPTVGTKEAQAVARVVESGYLAQGREVAAFEEECAAAVGRRYGVAVSSGTAALHLALIGLDVGAGDAVAMPSYACDALAQAALWLRAVPVPCDIDDDFNLDPNRVPESVSAVILPHLFGATASLPRCTATVEDIAHSIGGPTGTNTLVGITSFYATKMMTTGEGGMIFTDDIGLAKMMRELRDYDRRDDLQVRYACKMTDFQAAMGRVQLRRLPEFIARRREIAQRYDEGLRDLPLRLPRIDDSVHFRYVIATPERERLTDWLQARGIGAARPVYRPLHHVLGGECPKAERAHQFNISLPIYPALTTAEVAAVVQSVATFYENVP